MEHGQHVALRLRQLDAGAVAALEARFADLHIFSLQCRGYAAHEDDGLGIAHLGQQFLHGGCYLVLDVEVQGRIAVLLSVVYLYAVVLSGLHRQLFLATLYAVAYFPDVDDSVAVDYQA